MKGRRLLNGVLAKNPLTRIVMQPDFGRFQVECEGARAISLRLIVRAFWFYAWGWSREFLSGYMSGKVSVM